MARLGLDRRAESDAPSVELVHVDGGEDDLLAASLFEAAGASEARDPRQDRGPRPRWSAPS